MSSKYWYCIPSFGIRQSSPKFGQNLFSEPMVLETCLYKSTLIHFNHNDSNPLPTSTISPQKMSHSLKVLHDQTRLSLYHWKKSTKPNAGRVVQSQVQTARGGKQCAAYITGSAAGCARREPIAGPVVTGSRESLAWERTARAIGERISAARARSTGSISPWSVECKLQISVVSYNTWYRSAASVKTRLFLEGDFIGLRLLLICARFCQVWDLRECHQEDLVAVILLELIFGNCYWLVLVYMYSTGSWPQVFVPHTS